MHYNIFITTNHWNILHIIVFFFLLLIVVFTFKLSFFMYFSVRFILLSYSHAPPIILFYVGVAL